MREFFAFFKERTLESILAGILVVVIVFFAILLSPYSEKFTDGSIENAEFIDKILSIGAGIIFLVVIIVFMRARKRGSV